MCDFARVASDNISARQGFSLLSLATHSVVARYAGNFAYARSGRLDRAADRELRDRHGHPGRQRPLPAHAGHREPGADDRLLGVPMGVTVPRDPGPHRGVGDLLQPRPRTAAGDVFEVAQLAAASNGSPSENCSTVSVLTVTGTDAS